MYKISNREVDCDQYKDTFCRFMIVFFTLCLVFNGSVQCEDMVEMIYMYIVLKITSSSNHLYGYNYYIVMF